MGKYSIKDLELLSGIKAHTLRIWEQRYGLVQPERSDTNIRTYTDVQLKKILSISTLNNSGYKISKIAAMSPSEIALALLQIKEPQTKTDMLINDLLTATIEMSKAKVLAVLEQSKNFDNLQNFFVKVVFPFLNKVGTLWTTESINPAQEHFTSNIIKRFLTRKIEDLNEPKAEADLYLLLLPEGDWHELSLLVAEYLLKKNGKRVLYLGASVPQDDLIKILRITKVDHVLCVSILTQDLKNVQTVVNLLCTNMKSGKVFFAGRAFYQSKLDFPPNAIVLESFDELVDF